MPIDPIRNQPPIPPIHPEKGNGPNWYQQQLAKIMQDYKNGAPASQITAELNSLRGAVQESGAAPSVIAGFNGVCIQISILVASGASTSSPTFSGLLSHAQAILSGV